MNDSRLSARDLAFMQRYPVVFGCGPRHVRQTPLAWGLAVGDGWLPLLDRLCTGLSRVIAEDGVTEFRTLQVKERFGGLRFYVTGGNDRTRALIEAAESESLRICEGGRPTGGTFSVDHHALKLLPAPTVRNLEEGRLMKVLMTADLHFDSWLRSGRDPYGGILPVLETLDALIIAGDIADNPAHGWPTFFGWLKHVIDPGKVWVIPGNHDYYGWRLDDDEGLRRIAEGCGVNFAQKRVIELDGYRFLCCTLWTDFRLTGDLIGAMRAVQDGLADYDRITIGPDRQPIDPSDTLDLHHDHLLWLEGELGKRHDGRTIVVTHHAPHPEVAGSTDRLSAGFASNLDGFIRRHHPDAWSFGHTHRLLGARIGQGATVTRLINVSLGYPSEVYPDSEAQKRLLRGLILGDETPKERR